MDNVWQLIILITTNILTGGIIKLITIRSEKKKAAADARKLENIANQELEKARSQEITNTENVIKLYKEALEDIKKLNEREKSIMSKTIEDQDKKIEELTKGQISSNNLIKELTEKVNNLSSDLVRLKVLVDGKCSTCEFKETCMKYKTYQEESDENN